MKFDVSMERERLEVIANTPRGDVRVTITEHGAGIGLEGHNTASAKDGEMDEIVFLAYDYEDYPVLFVWGDINEEDRTQRIVLRDSEESNRREV